MPQMYSSTRASAAYIPDAAQGLVGKGIGGIITPDTDFDLMKQRRIPAGAGSQFPAAQHNAIIKHLSEPQHMRRIVQVYIADTYDSIPLDKQLLYTGEQKFTDLTDQELYFEIDVKGILDKHNEYRTTVRDKRVKDREEFLEPARVRDLKMIVVTVATFP